MPKVGNRHFPYTPEGYRQAKEYARVTGQKVQVDKPKRRRRKARKGVRDG
jgi:hypothetical protein